MVGRTGAKEEALEFFIFFIFFGGEAYVAAVALFICIIVQAGLWALERCFVCHSLAGPGIWGGAGEGGVWSLAFVMINIQADSHLEPRLALPGFGFIYIYVCISSSSFIIVMCFFLVFYAFALFHFFSFSSFSFCKQPALTHWPLFFNATQLLRACTRMSSRDLGRRRAACRGTRRFDQVQQRMARYMRLDGEMLEQRSGDGPLRLLENAG